MPQPSIPAPSVLAGLKQALLPQAPFSAMGAGDLDRVVRASQLKYFAPGEVILAPAAGRPAHCYVIRQGTVRGERPGATGDAAALWELSGGEMFPLGALLAGRGVTSVYRAAQDTFFVADVHTSKFSVKASGLGGRDQQGVYDARTPLRVVAGQSLLTLSSVDEDTLGEDLQVIWELETWRSHP